MARIEDKRKSKKDLGNKIWTGIVATVLASVVIAGLIFVGILLFGNKDEENEEKVYDEVFPEAELITFEDLNSIFDIHTPDQNLLVNGTIYVLVYSPAYAETLEEGTVAYEDYQKLLTSVNSAVEFFGEDYSGDDAFYVINVLSEDNKGLSATGEYLDQYNKSGESLTSLTSPYLLVIERGDNGDFEIGTNGVYTTLKGVISKINKATK